MASPVILQPAEAAGIDAHISSVNPTTNYVSANPLYIGDNTGSSSASRVLIAFTMPPELTGTTITAVTLSLWEAYAGNNATGRTTWAANLHRMLRNWVENQCTWNIYSTGNNWETAGCGSAGTDRATSPSASVTLDGSAANNWVEWSGAGLIADVQAWVNGTASNYGWLLEAPDAEYTPTAAQLSYNGFVSSTELSAPTHRPKLTIEYTAAAGIAKMFSFYSRLRG